VPANRLRLSRLVGTRFQVLFHSPPGVLFTFPSRYLSAIGHQGVFRLSGWSRQIHTEFHGLGATWETSPGDATFSCTGLSPSTATPSRGLPLTTAFSHSPLLRQKELDGPTTPTTQRLPAITCDRFSLIRFRSPLLTESRLFSLPVGTEMFHFPTFPPHALCVQARVTPHDWCGVPPFGNPRINARLTAPRGLSQPPTSFIGSWCQGIHRAPLTTWPHKKPTHPRPEGHRRAGTTYTNPALQSQKMLASTVQFSTYDQTPATRPRRTHHRPEEQPRRADGGTRNRPAPTEATVARSLRTQQRAYDRHPRPRLRSTPTPEEMSRTGSPPREPAELVSVPPSSTTPHAPPTTPDEQPITMWAQLCTTSPKARR
jgi:hypothetical protein